MYARNNYIRDISTFIGKPVEKGNHRIAAFRQVKMGTCLL